MKRAPLRSESSLQMTQGQIEPYENTLSVEELRRELRYYIDAHYGVIHALRDLPEMPPPFILLHLGAAAKWPDDSNRGKELQQKLGSGVIPFKSECECGAGLWDRIRRGLTGGEEQ